MQGQGVKPHDQDTLGRWGHPGGEVALYNTRFPSFAHCWAPGELSALVTFCAWPRVPSLLMSVYQPTTPRPHVAPVSRGLEKGFSEV